MNWKNKVIELIKDLFYKNQEEDDLLLMDMYSEYKDKLFFVSRKVDIKISLTNVLNLELINICNEDEKLKSKFIDNLKKITI